jgi:tape measure domain-containing protein
MTPEEVVIYAMMRGKRQFVRDVTEMGYSIRALGLESETVGRSFERVAHRGFLMNQALFTIRRFSYMGTLALTGAGAAAIKWGFDYNNAIQTAQVALQKFFPSQQALNDSLQRLWTIAKFTPFQIRDMTTAFRALYPAFRSLGISANSTIDTIQGIIDGLSVAGKVSGPALQRATIALQHMAFQGRLTGISVNSLARDGIPIFAILRSELGLTGDQMHRIGQLGIPANVAMQAIIHYMRTTPGYAGAAYRQSTMTVSGLFSTFKDNMSRLMGELEKNFFGRIQGRLVTMNQWFNRFGNSINTSGRSVTDIIRAIDPAAVVLWRQIAGDLNLFWINFRNLTREVFHSKALWGTLYLGLLLLHGVLYALVPLTNHFGWALNILVPLFVTYVVWTKAAAFWSGVLAAEEAILTKTTGELTFAQFLLKGAAIATAVAMRGLAIATAIWEVASAGYARGAGGQFRAMTTLERLVYRTRLAFLAGIRSIVAFGVAVKGLWTVAVAGYARGANGQFRALTTLEKLVLRLRLAMFAAARATLAFGKAVLLLGRTILVFLATNPIGWAILLISVLVILYFKWKWFHNLVNGQPSVASS